MKKKILSMTLAVLMAFSGLLSLQCANITTEAATDYAATLRNLGFPESYISKLTALHNKYPNWEFKPLITGYSWDTAVSSERSYHAKQLIQKTSSTSSSMMCQCSSCYKNGKYVIQEGSSWVSASKSAVEYYMDPRNMLTEQYIFQFESTSYDANQTKTGVESILKNTWMYKSLIKYYGTDGKTTYTYNNSTKYSDAILAAAKNSGMSAYYLASKIVQEVGGSSASKAGGSCGTRKPFYGIYNYYNIGANSGALEGLEWAAGWLKVNDNKSKVTLYSSYNSAKNKGTGTTTTLYTDQRMVWRATKGDYYYVRLYSGSDGSYQTGASGYIKKSDCRTTYLNYGRPWSNPYKAIYYGASYIANSYSKYQNTGYLQKFNVNPDSPNTFNHEYMANVSAAASESSTTYSAYKSAGILSAAKTFVIPVYTNMPDDSSTTVDVPQVKNLAVSSIKGDSVNLSWNKVSGTTKYKVQVYKQGKWVTYSYPKTNSVKITGLSNSTTYKFRVKALRKIGSTFYKGKYSKKVTCTTKIGQITGVGVSQRSTTYLTLKWDEKKNVTGYKIYKYNTKTQKYELIKTIKGSTKHSYKISNLNKGTKYRFKIQAYKTTSGKTEYGGASSIFTTTTSPGQVTIIGVSNPKSKKIVVNWQSVKASGFQIQWSTTSDFSSNVKSVSYDISQKTSTTLTTYYKSKTYYVRVRAYRYVNSTAYYGKWSEAKKIYVK